MKIIQGGQRGIAAQFEAAGIEVAKAPDPAAAETTEAKVDPAKPLDDDTEDENGLTAQQRAELTKKHQRAIGRKHAALKEAEALAQSEFSGRRQAEERVEALQRELDELKNAKKQAQEPIRPKRDSFETQEGYEDALLAYGREVDRAEGAKKRAEEADKAEKERQQAVMKRANEQIAKARELVPDFEEVVSAANSDVPPHIAEYMQESELFAELGYHFAQHPGDLERLAKLPVKTYGDIQRLGVAIAKIEGKIKPFADRTVDDNVENNPMMAKADTSNGKTSEEKSAPSPTATAPSKRPAPVITPLPTGTGSQSEGAPRTQQEHVNAFGKREGVNLYQRKRH